MLHKSIDLYGIYGIGCTDKFLYTSKIEETHSTVTLHKYCPTTQMMFRNSSVGVELINSYINVLMKEHYFLVILYKFSPKIT